MRKIFVLGAKEWMAGKNGSKQNDKLLLGYSDMEWDYIWTTMLTDGAWSVSPLRDEEGKIVKENDAPEILIKYIAHVLMCNIIVFDLKLKRIQFLSGNHVKDNNVVFQSPLLLYNTGGHFQSVMQKDHEYFIRLARMLEAEHEIPTKEKMQESDQNPLPKGRKACVSLPHTKRKRKEDEDEEIQEFLKSTKRRRILDCDLDISSFEKLCRINTKSKCEAPSQERTYKNIFSAIHSTQPKNDHVIVPLNDAELNEDQILQIHSVYSASMELKEKYKHKRKDQRSDLEQKFLKKARYNVIRIQFLFPNLAFNSIRDQKSKEEEEKNVLDNSHNKKSYIDWKKVRI